MRVGRFSGTALLRILGAAACIGICDGPAKTLAILGLSLLARPQLRFCDADSKLALPCTSLLLEPLELAMGNLCGSSSKDNTPAPRATQAPPKRSNTTTPASAPAPKPQSKPAAKAKSPGRTLGSSEASQSANDPRAAAARAAEVS